jgi:DNA-binding Xre family transcriptional regulator
MKSQNPRHGSSFDEFMKEEGMLDEVEDAAIKRVIAYQVKKAMDNKRLTKAELARLMRTSRTAVDRLLDPENESVTLNTLRHLANALGMRLKISLQP